MAKNVQETVFEIIKFSKQSGLRHIQKSQIKDELLKTHLGKYEQEKWRPDHPEVKETKLDNMLTQALYQLTRNNKIKKKGKGKYSINTDTNKYKPIICKHLQERERGMFCPIKNVYIGDPRAQCELLHGTNYDTLKKQVTPMCPGYTDKTPTSVSIKYAKKQIALQEKKREDVFNQAVSRRGK